MRISRFIYFLFEGYHPGCPLVGIEFAFTLMASVFLSFIGVLVSVAHVVYLHSQRRRDGEEEDID